jgi:hypothetical protein
VEQYKIDFDSMPWENPAVGVRFKAYEQGGREKGPDPFFSRNASGGQI